MSFSRWSLKVRRPPGGRRWLSQRAVSLKVSAMGPVARWTLANVCEVIEDAIVRPGRPLGATRLSVSISTLSVAPLPSPLVGFRPVALRPAVSGGLPFRGVRFLSRSYG